jgi:hypothetical protein
MPLFVMIGAISMSLALIFYTIGIAMTVITGKVRKRQVVLQAIAICFDAFGTVCMVINSGGVFIPVDVHGWLGYIALAGMAVDLGFVIKHRSDGLAATPIRLYSAAIWALWVISYSMGFSKMS